MFMLFLKYVMEFDGADSSMTLWHQNGTRSFRKGQSQASSKKVAKKHGFDKLCNVTTPPPTRVLKRNSLSIETAKDLLLREISSS